MAGHAGDQLELGLDDLLEADLGQVGVEEQEVVLGMVDRRDADETVVVADPRQAPQLAEPAGRGGGSGGGEVGDLGPVRHFSHSFRGRGLTTLSCDGHHTSPRPEEAPVARRHPQPLLRPHAACRAVRGGRGRAAVRRGGDGRRQGRERVSRGRGPRGERRAAGPGGGRRRGAGSPSEPGARGCACRRSGPGQRAAGHDHPGGRRPGQRAQRAGSGRGCRAGRRALRARCRHGRQRARSRVQREPAARDADRPLRQAGDPRP